MRIIDYADFVMGKESPWKLSKEPYRVDEDGLALAVKILNIHPTAKRNLEVIDSPKLFYTKEPDMAKDITRHMREELFYALKLGYASKMAPAKLIYFIQKAFLEYGSPNFIFKIALEKDLQDFLSEGYLEKGYTLRDVICSVTKRRQYAPLSQGKLAVQIGEHWDVYIGETDAIAMMPTDLKNLLSHEDIRSLKVKGNKIYLGEKPINQLGRYLGVVNSCYDLRNLM